MSLKLIVISPQKSSELHVLLDSFFQLSILLVSDAATTSKHEEVRTDVETRPLNVSLRNCNSASGSADQSQYIIVREDLSIVKNKRCQLELKILEGALQTGSYEFAIDIGMAVDGQSISVSQYIRCFRYKLKISNLASLPVIFFKDDTGKDKGIEIHLALVDGNDQRVTTRQLPLVST